MQTTTNGNRSVTPSGIYCPGGLCCTDPANPPNHWKGVERTPEPRVHCDDEAAQPVGPQDPGVPGATGAAQQPGPGPRPPGTLHARQGPASAATGQRGPPSQALSQTLAHPTGTLGDADEARQTPSHNDTISGDETLPPLLHGTDTREGPTRTRRPGALTHGREGVRRPRCCGRPAHAPHRRQLSCGPSLLQQPLGRQLLLLLLPPACPAGAPTEHSSCRLHPKGPLQRLQGPPWSRPGGLQSPPAPESCSPWLGSPATQPGPPPATSSPPPTQRPTSALGPSRRRVPGRAQEAQIPTVHSLTHSQTRSTSVPLTGAPPRTQRDLTREASWLPLAAAAGRPRMPHPRGSSHTGFQDTEGRAGKGPPSPGGCPGDPARGPAALHARPAESGP